MHKGWVRIDEAREAKFWQNEGRPDKYRYIEETDPSTKGNITDAYVEYWEDVRDPDDEPDVDGLYEDCDEDRWIRLNGQWVVASDSEFIGMWSSWNEIIDRDAYTPFTLVDPSDY